VLSPHLDDAALSLGAAIDHAVRCGLHVDVLTVFAGDVASPRVAGRWDRRGGFRLEGEAASARRREDAEACQTLGARAVWLEFSDDQYAQEREPGAILAAIREHTRGADLVLAPGFPLEHGDHGALARLLAGSDLGAAAHAEYAEQPYAYGTRRAPGGDGWQSLVVPESSILAKDGACRAYRSQLRLLPPKMLGRIREYEQERGGETIRPAPGSLDRFAEVVDRRPDGRFVWISVV
jgi:LmbE family N-acetylglucosaminyl deacetylase